ncbi:MAG: hypothetical protein P8H36_02185 [Yoonia sp.]|nr:hypothetical protein [Yoonia sp.]
MPMIWGIIAAGRALRMSRPHLGMRWVRTVLHMGVHRTGTTSLQHMLDRNANQLGRKGVARLIVYEENMMGPIRVNMQAGALYPQAGARLARFGAAFRVHCDTIVVTIRSYDTYWESCLAYTKAVGMLLRPLSIMAQAATGPRGWRDVIRDLGAGFPDCDIKVAVYEEPADAGAVMLDTTALDDTHQCYNVTPAGAAPTFDPATRNQLRDRYATDIAWLDNGADGIATRITLNTHTDMDRIGLGELAKAGPGTSTGGHHGNQRRLV